MNPFGQPPAGAAGQRGFDTAQKAKDAAVAQPETKSFAVLQCRGEFAWVAPSGIAIERMAPALMAGISIVDMGQKP